MENTEMNDSGGNVAAVALSVARKRSKKIEAMRKAFESNDHRAALALAREICGLTKGTDA
jgi:hypothetical protein